MSKFKTWWRHKTRMIPFYLAEVYVFFEHPLKILVNYTLFLSIPLWVGPAYMVMIVHRAWASRKNAERSMLLGKIWFHEQYKIY